MAANGSAAERWLTGYAFWQMSTFGNYLCVTLDECAFNFPPQQCVGCDIPLAPRLTPEPSAESTSAAPTATPVPAPAACPAPRIAQGPPVLSITRVAPNFPLVVGQDPEQRGADIEARVGIPPSD